MLPLLDQDNSSNNLEHRVHPICHRIVGRLRYLLAIADSGGLLSTR